MVLRMTRSNMSSTIIRGGPYLVESATYPGKLVELYVGDDAQGSAIEVIGESREDPDAPGEWVLVVFHADRLRRSYRHYYEEQMRWRHTGA
jgi:hypothetical protein